MPLGWRLLILCSILGWSWRESRSFATRRARRPQFVHCQFAIAVFIQFLERNAGIGDFCFINHTIVICVQHCD